ncbi:hypothetical protein [Streptomyces sp. NPDC055189]
MTCFNPSGSTPGLFVAYGANDTGVRPAPAGTPLWLSPDIRLASQKEAPDLITHPDDWDINPWIAQVEVGTEYYFLVRVRNNDPERQRHFLNFQAWVCDFTLGGIGPASKVSGEFQGYSTVPLPAHSNPNAPRPMVVMNSSSLWKPTAEDLARNQGHHCVGVVAWAEADTVATPPTPTDGRDLVGSYIDPSCDRRHAQRNLSVIPKSVGIRGDLPIMLMVPVTDRCPLQAQITLRPVDLSDGAGRPQPVPELIRAAHEHGLDQLYLPDGAPFEYVGIGRAGGNSHEKDLHTKLKPGGRLDMQFTLDPSPEEKPGDVYAFDAVTTDTATRQRSGAARVYVLVTDRP